MTGYRHISMPNAPSHGRVGEAENWRRAVITPAQCLEARKKQAQANTEFRELSAESPRPKALTSFALSLVAGAAIWVIIRLVLRYRQMTEPRRVMCPACGFQAEDNGIFGLPVLTGDVDLYLHLCRRLNDAPPPARMFHCSTLRTAAKRAAMTAEIETSREHGS